MVELFIFLKNFQTVLLLHIKAETKNIIMKTKFFSFLTVAIALGMVACNDDADNTTTNEKSTTTMETNSNKM